MPPNLRKGKIAKMSPNVRKDFYRRFNKASGVRVPSNTPIFKGSASMNRKLADTGAPVRKYESKMNPNNKRKYNDR